VFYLRYGQNSLIIIDIFGLNKHENIFLLFSDYGKSHSHVHTQFTDLKETELHIPAGVFRVIQGHSNNRLLCGLADEASCLAAADGCLCSSSYYL
jgi:hypothetical protein